MGALPRAWVRALEARLPGPAIRVARSGDLPRIDALMAPHVASGVLLPRSGGVERFLVAVEGRRVVGAVALSPWSSEVVELGSLVVDRPGTGLGARLVEAAVLRAREAGYREVVALTGTPGFFLRCGWLRSEDAPWARARAPGVAGPERHNPALDAALSWKAGRCAGCARLGACRQVLLTLALEPRAPLADAPVLPVVAEAA